jgi:hypothetical protein
MPDYRLASRKYCVPVKFDFEVDFYALGAHVYTTENLIDPLLDKSVITSSNVSINYHDDLPDDDLPDGDLDKDFSPRFLVIEIQFSLDETYGTYELTEIARCVRPKLLIIYGILSFLANYPFTTYQVINTSISYYENSQVINKDEIKTFLFLVKGQDRSADLYKLLQAICSEEIKNKKFLASLLDRWRKALFLKRKSGSEELLYADEAFLAYFHTLELLASHCQKEIDKECDYKIQTFLIDIFQNTLKSRGSRLEQEVQNNLKQFRALLTNGGQISVYSKICYFLSQFGMLDAKSQNLVSILVDTRNKIAHGQQVYQEKLTWPLPPFFPLNEEPEYRLLEVEILAARAIAAHVGLDIWQEEWEDLHYWLEPPIDIIKKFISEKRFQEISSKQFLLGIDEGIRPSSIIEGFLSNKLKFRQLEESLRSVILDVDLSEDEVENILWAAIVLTDSKDEELSKRCKDIVEEAYNQSSAVVKDIFKYFEYKNIKLPWIEEWMEKKRMT